MKKCLSIVIGVLMGIGGFMGSFAKQVPLFTRLVVPGYYHSIQGFNSLMDDKGPLTSDSEGFRELVLIMKAQNSHLKDEEIIEITNGSFSQKEFYDTGREAFRYTFNIRTKNGGNNAHVFNPQETFNSYYFDTGFFRWSWMLLVIGILSAVWGVSFKDQPMQETKNKTAKKKHRSRKAKSH